MKYNFVIYQLQLIIIVNYTIIGTIFMKTGNNMRSNMLRKLYDRETIQSLIQIRIQKLLRCNNT